jgi:NAD(P)-dependent dehydrogenase (short-subunit alcohol dehydrogenase family)
MNDGSTMSGKICLVTGATAGIGKVTAAALAARGATLVIAGRNPQKTAAAAQEISAASGAPVDFLLADFGDLAQVRAMAVEFKRRYPRLDVLVNNAGAYFTRLIPLPAGFEMTLLVNHMAPFVLTLDLLEALRASPAARVVNVASEAHRFDNLDFTDLPFRRFYFGFFAYARSKLANVLFTYELERRYVASGITFNALHPGHVSTDIWQSNFGRLGPLLKALMRPIAITPREGADTLIYLAAAPEVKGISGKYFIKRKAVPSSPRSYDAGLARKLWEFSLHATL